MPVHVLGRYLFRTSPEPLLEHGLALLTVGRGGPRPLLLLSLLLTDRMGARETCPPTQGLTGWETLVTVVPMEFGETLRDLRTRQKVGLKKLAPELGVTYSYLSKLENGQTRPSDQLVTRVAAYFDYDSDTLMLAASRVPPDVLEILRAHPEEAIRVLRERFGTRDGGGPET